MSRKTILVLVALVTLAAGWTAEAAISPACAVDPSRLDATVRVEIWSSAVVEFVADHPELTPAQLRVLSRAPVVTAGLRQDLAATSERSRRTTASIRAFMADAQAAFSTQELADLFSRMGTLQSWLIQHEAFASETPFCNCSGQGPCKFDGGPTGDCAAGCESWDGDDGRRRDGICSSGGDLEIE